MVLPELSGGKELGKAGASGAPIRMGWVSPLRVATGGAANYGSEARLRRSPAHANETALDWFWTRGMGSF